MQITIKKNCKNYEQFGKKLNQILFFAKKSLTTDYRYCNTTNNFTTNINNFKNRAHLPLTRHKSFINIKN